MTTFLSVTTVILMLGIGSKDGARRMIWWICVWLPILLIITEVIK